MVSIRLGTSGARRIRGSAAHVERPRRQRHLARVTVHDRHLIVHKLFDQVAFERLARIARLVESAPVVERRHVRVRMPAERLDSHQAVAAAHIEDAGALLERQVVEDIADAVDLTA
eukprot:1365471-Prymnesium_polylepis.1